jgi:hypothetical protein
MVKEASEGRNKVTESGKDVSELLTIMRLLYSTFAWPQDFAQSFLRPLHVSYIGLPSLPTGTTLGEDSERL